MSKITFYYVSSCPTCQSYVNSMKDKDKEGVVHWHDMQKDMGDLGISYQEAVKQPLARDASGKLQRGVDAFITLWNELPAFRLIATGLNTALTKSLFSLYYQTFAEIRPNKHSCYRYHGCSERLTKKH